MKFNGSDYDPKIDNDRLSAQHFKIKNIMLDHKWRTLKEIADLSGFPESSISAQLRHLRKPRFGGFLIDKRSRGDRSNGLFEYRLLPKGENLTSQQKKRRNKYKEILTEVYINFPQTRKFIKEALND